MRKLIRSRHPNEGTGNVACDLQVNPAQFQGGVFISIDRLTHSQVVSSHFLKFVILSSCFQASFSLTIFLSELYEYLLSFIKVSGLTDVGCL